VRTHRRIVESGSGGRRGVSPESSGRLTARLTEPREEAPPSGYRAHTVRTRVRGAAEGALEPAAYAQAGSSSPNRGASARYFRLTRSIMRRLIWSRT